MLIRFYNVKTFVPEVGLTDAEVWVEDGKLRLVSCVTPLIWLPWDREIDGHGNLLLPTFKNAHAHSPMTFLRSWADDMALHDWLFRQVFPNEAKLTADDCYWMTKLAIAEYVSGGIGASADMYFHLPAIAQAGAECGFRQVILEGITANNLDNLERILSDGMKQIDGMGDGRISYRLGLHAEYTNTEASIRAMGRFAQEARMPVYAHVSETRKEVEECRARYGKSPVQVLCDAGIFDYGGTAYHCVHVDETDMRLLAEHNVHVVSCPASNLKLASGIAPLEAMRKAGLQLGLGTDGAASNNALDMFREMYLAATLSKAVTQDAAAMPAQYVLDMATKGGAHAMGLTDCDILRVGADADLMLIDLQSANMRPHNDLIPNLVYAGGKHNVLLTMVAGKILYEKGEYFLGESYDRIVTECERIVRRIREEA